MLLPPLNASLGSADTDTNSPLSPSLVNRAGQLNSHSYLFPMFDNQLLQSAQSVCQSSNVVPQLSSPSISLSEATYRNHFQAAAAAAAIIVLPSPRAMNPMGATNQYTTSPLSCLVPPCTIAPTMVQYNHRPNHFSSWVTNPTPASLSAEPQSSDTTETKPKPGRSQQRQCKTNTTAHAKLETGDEPCQPIKKHSCMQCFKCFNRASDLVKHLRTHTGEKPFICPHCSRAFSDSSSLSAHKRIHTGERPYRCTECSKAFAVSSSLVKHRRTHTGEKPYQCQVCGRAFADNSSCAAHRKRNQPCQQASEEVKYNNACQYAPTCVGSEVIDKPPHTISYSPAVVAPFTPTPLTSN